MSPLSSPEITVAPPVLPARYELLRHMGHGGMAHCWLARDRLLDRMSVFKGLRSKFRDDEKIRERFRREGIAAASVTHRCLVPVHDVLELDGHPFIVAAYMPGGNLFERVRREGPFSPIPFRKLAAELLAGLQCIHEQGIVHRDVKPANILFGADGDARLADFGVAHLAEELRITGTLELVGTPIYMAPEALRGASADVRADLFSLGRTLVFAANGSVRKNDGSSDYPPELHIWLKMLLVEDRALRFQTAREALRRLPSPGFSSSESSDSWAGGSPSAASVQTKSLVELLDADTLTLSTSDWSEDGLPTEPSG